MLDFELDLEDPDYDPSFWVVSEWNGTTYNGNVVWSVEKASSIA